MTRARAAALAIACGAACASFESAEVVLDTRVLAMRADLPEQILDLDPASPPTAEELLAQLQPTEVCALVADPARERRVRWTMTLCALDSDQRCSSRVTQVIASGLAEDPELARPAPALCATIQPDLTLLAIVLDVLEGDDLAGLGGIEYGVSLVVRGEDEPEALDQYAGKRLRVLPRIPAARTANVNPALTRLEGQIDGDARFELPRVRCADAAATATPLPELRARQRLRIHPIEAPGAREVYVVPRLDGQEQTFTESLTYQWLAGIGGFSSGNTGGPRDVSGAPPPLFTDYRAPPAKEITQLTDVPLWLVQRDERLGAAWVETCVRVAP